MHTKLITAAAIAVVLFASALPAQASSGANLKVGIVLPLTGDLAVYGGSLAKAAEMGISQVNAAIKANKLSGSCKSVGVEDDQTLPSAGVEAATKIVKTNKANIVVGSMASSVTLAIAQSVTIPNNVILISPASSNPNITNLKDKDTVFRVYPSDLLQAKALVLAMAKELGKGALVNIGNRNDAFGSALAASFRKGWMANGGKIGAEVNWDPNAATFDSEAQKLAGGKPDGWLIVDFDGTYAKVAPALARTGLWNPAKTFMTESFNSKGAIANVGAKFMEGVRGTSATSDGASKDAFQALFKKSFPTKEFTGFEGTAFDSAVLACLAGVSAKSTRTKDLIPALRKVSGPKGAKYTWQQLKAAVKDAAAGKPIAYYGAWAEVDFDKKGDPGAGVFDLYSIKDGVPSSDPTKRISFKG